jgi:hypothetical protein
MTPIAADEPDVQLRAELAALRLASICDRPITPATIRKWDSRGRVHRTSTQGRAATYSTVELQTYADTLYRAS